MLSFTKEQLSAVMCKHAEKENGLHDLLEIMLESLMVAERGEFLRGQEDHNKGNGSALVTRMAMDENLSSRYPETVSATFIRRYLPS